MTQSLSKEYSSKIVFIRKFLKYRRGGATHGIAEINCIAKIDGKSENVYHHKHPSAHVLITMIVLLMEGEEYHNYPNGIGIEYGRGIEHQSTPKQFEQMRIGHILCI